MKRGDLGRRTILCITYFQNIFSGDEAPKWLLRFQAQVKDYPDKLVVHGNPPENKNENDTWEFRGIYELNRKSVATNNKTGERVALFIDFKKIIDYGKLTSGIDL